MGGRGRIGGKGTLSSGKFKIFSSRQEVKKFFDKNTEDWYYKKLGRSEQIAIERYTGPYFEDINNYLRRGLQPNISIERVKEYSENLTGAFDKTGLPENMTLFRGGGYALVKGYLDGETNPAEIVKILNQNKGGLLVDKGFMSASAIKRINYQAGTGNVIYEIKAPKGSRAQWVDPVSYNKGENEVLIDKMSLFKIVKARQATEKDRVESSLHHLETVIVVELINSRRKK